MLLWYQIAVKTSYFVRDFLLLSGSDAHVHSVVFPFVPLYHAIVMAEIKCCLFTTNLTILMTLHRHFQINGLKKDMKITKLFDYISQGIKQNVLLSSYLDSWGRHKLRIFLDQPLKQWVTGKKRGEDENTKIWISRERKELFRWNKNIFHSFWRAIIWRKKKFGKK